MQENTTFASLMSPVTVEEFFRLHWEEGPLHVSSRAKNKYDHALTATDLDEYFHADNLSPHFLRVIRAGAECAPDQWSRIEQRKNTDPYRVVDAEKLFSLFGDGATIVINAAQTAFPRLNDFCAALESDLKTRIQFNVYITPPRGVGLGWHYDPHDVFILQISGHKHWRLYDYPEKLLVTSAPLQKCEYEGKEPKQTVDLQAGDLLYLPRGTVHFASSLDESSIHVTVSLMSRYRFHLLEELASIAQEDQFFRRTLPHGFSTAVDKSAFVEEFREQLQYLISKVRIEDLMERSNEDFLNHQLIDRKARFTDLLQLDRLTLDSVISSRPVKTYEIEQDSSTVVIRIGRERLSLPRFLRPVLDSLLQQKSRAVRDLSGPLSDSGKIDLVKKLIESGLLKIERV